MKNIFVSFLVYDATNTTRERRKFVLKNCLPRGINVFYVESVCTDPEIVKNNILDVKLNGPDYKNLAPTTEEALEDFVKRIRHYEDSYEPLDEQIDTSKLNWTHLSFQYGIHSLVTIF